MPIQNEGMHAAEFLLSEANGARSREKIIIASGNDLSAAAVLGKTVTASATGSADAGNTGDGTIGSVTAGSAAKDGRYTISCVEPGTDAGEFRVEDPDGNLVGNASVGSAFSEEIGFTISDGVTNFEVGDIFYVDVDVTAEQFTELDPTASDGSEVAAAILYAATDASAAAKDATGVVRDAEVVDADLQWPTGATDAQKATAKDQLAKLGIIAR